MGMKTNFNVRHNQPFLKKSERKQIHQFLLPNKAFSFFQQGFFPPVQKLVSGDKAVGFLPGRQRKLALSLFFFFFLIACFLSYLSQQPTVSVLRDPHLEIRVHRNSESCYHPHGEGI